MDERLGDAEGGDSVTQYLTPVLCGSRAVPTALAR